MTVKEIYEYYPNSVFFIRGFGKGYPTRRYPEEFSTRELKKLASKQVISIEGAGFRYGSNTITIRVEEEK